MFDLDILLFNYLYGLCKAFGGVFSLGAFEGFIMYSSILAWGTSIVINAKKVQKK